MDSILNYPIIPLDIYKRYKDAKKFRVYDTDTFWQMINAIKADCKNGSAINSRLAQLIVFDLKMRINHPTVYKENSSAKVLEQRMAYLCNGQTGDDIFKHNPDINHLLSTEEIKSIPDESYEEISTSIASNYREKGDVIIFNPREVIPYKISIKSLIPDNEEVNFGSCSFPSLFVGIDDELKNLGERKSKYNREVGNKTYKVGRGSRAQLVELFAYLEEVGLLSQFMERFELIFKGVFKEDVLFYIKDHDHLIISMMKNEEFISCVLESVKNHYKEKSKFVISRWEGNSIRMDRKILMKNCKRSINIRFDSLIDEAELVGILKSCDYTKVQQLLK